MVLAIVFFFAILACGYLLYTLPDELGLRTGYGTAFSKVYVTVAVTFVVGSIAIYLALSSKKEVIVFKDRTADDDGTQAEGPDDKHKTTISLEHVRSVTESAEDKTLFNGFLQAVCGQLEAGQGAYYETGEADGVRKIRLRAGYALSVGEGSEVEFDFGEGLAGQSAAEGKTLYVDDIPEGYIKIMSGLGTASPRFLLIVPVKNSSGGVVGIIEMASFKEFTEDQRKFVEQAAQVLAERIVTK